MLKKRVFTYIKRFGLFHGLYLFFTVRRSRSAGIIKFRIPGLVHPVFLRRNSSDFFVFEEIFIDEIYKNSCIKDEIHYIIDAGANIGLFTLYFLKKYSTSKIICVEPEDGNFELLKSNLIQYKNVTLIKAALWDKQCYLKIQNPIESSWAFEVVETNKEGKQFEALSVDQILEKYDIPRIDILKIDIEGSEREVFASNNSWISKVKYLIVEIHENMRPGAHDSVMKLTSINNFRFFQNLFTFFFYK